MNNNCILYLSTGWCAKKKATMRANTMLLIRTQWYGWKRYWSLIKFENIASLSKHYPLKSQVNSGTTCIFMSSGHLNTGFIMEFFCEYDHWVVNLMWKLTKTSSLLLKDDIAVGLGSIHRYLRTVHNVASVIKASDHFVILLPTQTPATTLHYCFDTAPTFMRAE